MNISGGYNPVNWLNQARRNLTIKYLNLDFVTTCIHFFAEKVLISYIWLIPFSLVCIMDRVPRPSFFDTDTL